MNGGQMDISQAVVDAYRFWDANTSHNRGSDLYEDPPLQPYDADQALHALEMETERESALFWREVDRVELRSRFIEYVNYRLRASDKTYDSVMAERTQALAANAA